MQLVSWARSLAAERLCASLPRRWCHVQGVAARAKQLSTHLGDDGAVLEAAAWLHDVGYAPELAVTGFHPLDGARFLVSIDVPRRVVDLVAQHSAAAAEADALGCAVQLAEFPDERTLVRDLLWYVDMTVGPDGQGMGFEERMDDVRARYSPDHYVVRALDAGMPERRAAIDRAEEWVERVGLTGQV